MDWKVSGSYFEACNCDAVCPCRQVGGAPGGRSTHGVCQFVLSWQIAVGRAGDITLDGLSVVLAGWYNDDVASSPWSVNLYVDDHASDDQARVLTDIFLGRAGGDTWQNYAQAIATIHEVRRARIELSHQPRRWRIKADTYISVQATRPLHVEQSVACGIPGLDRPGQEVVSDELLVSDAPLDWNLHERCGFATDFQYSSA